MEVKIENFNGILPLHIVDASLPIINTSILNNPKQKWGVTSIQIKKTPEYTNLFWKKILNSDLGITYKIIDDVTWFIDGDITSINFGNKFFHANSNKEVIVLNIQANQISIPDLDD